MKLEAGTNMTLTPENLMKIICLQQINGNQGTFPQINQKRKEGSVTQINHLPRDTLVGHVHGL